MEVSKINFGPNGGIKFIPVAMHPKCCECGTIPEAGEPLYPDYDYLQERVYYCAKCYSERK